MNLELANFSKYLVKKCQYLCSPVSGEAYEGGDTTPHSSLVLVTTLVQQLEGGGRGVEVRGWSGGRS